MKAHTVALIDIGSNTIRLNVFRVEGDSFSSLFTKKSMAGLGGYIEEGKLSQAGIDRAIESLTYLGRTISNFDIDETRVFATASLRDIDNTEEAVSKIEKHSKVPIEVLSSDDEALLSYSGFNLDCHLETGSLCDIGGGSTEVVGFKLEMPEFTTSFPIGSLKLFSNFVSGIIPTKSEVSKMDDEIRTFTKTSALTAITPEKSNDRMLCGVGGTARAALKLAQRSFDLPSGGKMFEISQLDDLIDHLIDGQRDARNLLLRTCPERIHTVIPGMLILRALARRLKSKKILVSSYGIREGYLCERILGR